MASYPKILRYLLWVVLGLLGAVIVAILGLVTYETIMEKTQIERAIARLNAKSASDPFSINLAYKSIETSGLLTHTVRLVDPALTITVTTPPVPATIGQATPAPSESLRSRMQVNGALDITTDYLTHRYTGVLHGAQTVELALGAQAPLVMSAPDTNTQVILQTDSLLHFIEQQMPHPNDPQAGARMLRQLALVEVDISPLVFSDPTTHALLLRSNAGKIAIANRGHDGKIDADFTLSLTGLEATQAYAALVNQYMVSSNPLYLRAGITADQLPFSSERAGPQDIILHGSLAMSPQEKVGNDCMPLQLTLDQFTLRNNFVEIVSPLSLTLKPSGTSCAVTYDNQFDLTVKPAEAAEAERFVALLQSMPLPMTNPAAPATSAHDPQLTKQKIMALLPTLSTLGPIHFSIKFNGNFPLQPGTGKPTVTVDQLNLTHSRWGIESHGNFNPTGAVNADLLCRRCDFLTYDLMTTAMQAKELSQLYGMPASPIPLGAPLLAEINALLATIGSKDPATGNISFSLTTAAPGDVRLNNRPMAQVMAYAMQKLQPYLAVPAAPVQAVPAGAAMRRQPARHTH